MRPLVVLLVVQVVLGGAFVALAATDNLPFTGDDLGPSRAATTGGADGSQPGAGTVDRFDEDRAFAWLRRQVALGPRPAGSRASRRLAARLRAALPRGRYVRVRGGLRNVVGTVTGRDPSRTVVIGAHYDTKDLPRFVGANDGAGGTAAVIELARQIRRRPLGPTAVFILFDGEESPAGTPDGAFERRGLRGSRAIAGRYRDAEAMVLLDFVAGKGLALRREGNSDAGLWARLRAAARRVGAEASFPAGEVGAVSDDHLPFIRAGVPSIDLIDYGFLTSRCWHQPCDDLSAVSKESLDRSGESTLELLRTL